VVVSTLEEAQQEDAKEHANEEHQDAKSDHEPNNGSNSKWVFRAHLDVAVLASPSLETAARVVGGNGGRIHVLEAVTLRAARGVATNTSKGMNRGVEEGVIGSVESDVHAVNTTFGDRPIDAKETAARIESADVSEGARGREDDIEVGLVDVGLVVEETIAGLEIERAVVAVGRIETKDDGVGWVHHGWNDGGLVGIVEDQNFVEGNSDVVSPGPGWDVSSVERSVYLVTCTDLGGGHITVPGVRRIERDGEVRGSPVDAEGTVGDGDAELVGSINLEGGVVTGDVSIDRSLRFRLPMNERHQWYLQ